MTDKQLARLFNSGSRRALTETKVAYDKLLMKMAMEITNSEEIARKCVDKVYEEILSDKNPINEENFASNIFTKVRRESLAFLGGCNERASDSIIKANEFLKNECEKNSNGFCGFVKRNWAWLIGFACLILILVAFAITGGARIEEFGLIEGFKQWFMDAFFIIFSAVAVLVAIIYYIRHKNA